MTSQPKTPVVLGWELLSSVNEPVPFGGTHEEADENYNTHQWYEEFGDIVCAHCGSKQWHKAAFYRCGVEPPRRISDTYRKPDGEIVSVYSAADALL